MKKLILCLIMLCGSAFAQGAFWKLPQPLPNAKILVCPIGTSNPCPSPSSIFSDSALTQAVGNPVNIGPDGRFGFWVLAGQYTIYVGLPYNISFDISLGGGLVPGSGGVVPGVIDPVRKVVLYADGVAGVAAVFHGSAPITLAQGGTDGETATQPAGRIYQSSASASTNVVAGFEQGMGANPGQGSYTFGTVSRVVLSIRIFNTTNVRYWIGMSDGSSGSFTGSSANFATDTPNFYYCMFRYSAGVDTTWKAVCATNSANQTVVDTGIAPSTTTATLFEIQNPNYGTMSSAVFSINGVTVATITTNLPTAANIFGQMWSADNKNTATAVGGGFFWGELFFYK